MKKIFVITVLIIAALTIKAQGTLQFNAAKIVTNILQTVPANKVWKVTAIYGADRICIPSVYPDYTPVSSLGQPGYYVAYIGTSMVTNGVNIYSYRTWNVPATATNINIYNDAGCTTVTNSGNPRGWAAYDIAANPNILPQWLPTGTTLKSNSANVFISVLEFNIIP